MIDDGVTLLSSAVGSLSAWGERLGFVIDRDGLDDHTISVSRSST